MAGGDYDDLDDLLDDEELQAEILKKSPAGGAPSTPSSAKTPATPADLAASTETGSKVSPAAETGSKPVPNGSTTTPSASATGASGADPLANADLSGLEALANNISEEDAEKMLRDLLGKIGITDLDSMDDLAGLADKVAAEMPTRPPPAAGAGAGAGAGAATGATSAAGAAGGAEEPSFQDTISATMDRLSKSQKPDFDENDADMDNLSSLLKNLQGDMSQDGLDSIIGSLLNELSSKETMYEPLKDLHVSYPAWLEKNSSSLPEADLKRFKEQYHIVGQVVARYESPKYSDASDADREYITGKMSEMQATGAPPDDLVKTVSGGAIPGLGDGAMPDMPGDCATQ